MEQEMKQAERVDISSIEKDLARNPRREARRWMRVVVNPKIQPMPGGYLCEQGENLIAVPESKVNVILAMAATSKDRDAMKMAHERFAEEMEKARKSGVQDGAEGFSVQSLFRQITGRDYPPLESAELVEREALPPEVPLSEERALEAQARIMADVVKRTVFSQPD